MYAGQRSTLAAVGANCLFSSLTRLHYLLLRLQHKNGKTRICEIIMGSVVPHQHSHLSMDIWLTAYPTIILYVLKDHYFSSYWLNFCLSLCRIVKVSIKLTRHNRNLISYIVFKTIVWTFIQNGAMSTGLANKQKVIILAWVIKMNGDVVCSVTFENLTHFVFLLFIND